MRTLDDAGYAPSHLRLWRIAGRSASGLILVAGVVGSGKSTSMKIFIETLPGLPFKAIYTVEDPIEYEIRGAHQIEVLRDLGDDNETRRRYAKAMKGLLRADLDGCFIGEVRDGLTAGFALQISETGHLSLATVHVHLISSIVPRLTNDDVGLSRQALTSPNIINLLVYQSLVPLLCQKCAEPPDVASAADPEVAELLAFLKTEFKVPTHRMRFKHVGGCAACGASGDRAGRGTTGRTVVAEMWQPDRTWLQHVRAGDDYAGLLHYRSHSDADFCSENMDGKTVFEHALFKAIHGQIDPRECNTFDSFERFEILRRPAPEAQTCA